MVGSRTMSNIVLPSALLLVCVVLQSEGKYIDVLSLTESPQKSSIDAMELEKKLNPGDNSTSADATCTSKPSFTSFSGKSQERYRWRNGYFVQLDPNWDEDEVALINDALYELGTKICIPIRIHKKGTKPKGDYSFILKNPNGGCSSPVGKQGGKQTINLNPDGCMYKGIIMHENIHSLGFNHEQTRPDRDEYVTVDENNIDPDYVHNYDIAQGSLTFDVPYDYSSIMHYGSYDFSQPKDQPAMLKKDGSEIVKQRDGLTDSDVLKLRRMYNCEES